METHSNPARHFVSECPLPAMLPATTTNVAVVVDTCELLRLQAAELIAAAGLPAMKFTASVTHYPDGISSYWLRGIDSCPRRNTFNETSAHALASSFERCLNQFASAVLVWAENNGLLQTMEGSPARA